MAGKNKQFSNGFTLIELLITVIAAIALLIGITGILAAGHKLYQTMFRRTTKGVVPDAYSASRTFDLIVRKSTIKRLDKIVWKEIAGMSLKQIFSDIEIATGREKAYAIHDIVHTFSSPLSDVMYVSNDSTDTEAIELVKSGGGLTVSLNGDEAAVRNSEISILSDNNAVIAVLSDLFLRLGKNEALKAAGNWDKDFLWRTSADPAILERLFAVPAEKWPKVRIVSEWNMKLIIDESNAFRKTVQGELSHP